MTTEIEDYIPAENEVLAEENVIVTLSSSKTSRGLLPTKDMLICCYKPCSETMALFPACSCNDIGASSLVSAQTCISILALQRKMAIRCSVTPAKSISRRLNSRVDGVVDWHAWDSFGTSTKDTA